MKADIPLPPEEWDFRDVPKEAAWWVEFYESAREHQDLRDVKNNRLSSRACRALSESAPYRRLYDFITTCPEFPAPWLLHRPKDEWVWERFNPDFGACQITPIKDNKLPWNPEFICADSADTRMPSPDYLLQVNWSLGKDAIRKQFECWLKGVPVPRGIKRAKHGRAKEAPWAKLKQLAALRLSKTGMDFSSLREALKRHRISHPISTGNDALPIYKGAKEWNVALDRARQRLEEFFPL